MRIGKFTKWMLLSWVILFSACNSTKEVVYLQDVVPLKQQDIERKYEVFIHEDDLLSIMVNSKDPELALPFNMPLITYQIGSESSGQQRVLGYLVDTNGDIDFPILGKLHVAGLSRLELRDLIKEKLISGDYIKDPVVTVQFLNYKVSVMGEVARPGSFTITGDRITLLEALSMAGDLTIYGRRDRVAVIREEMANGPSCSTTCVRRISLPRRAITCSRTISSMSNRTRQRPDNGISTRTTLSASGCRPYPYWLPSLPY